MDEATFGRWHEIHVRSGRGETLTAEEQAAYDSGCTELDSEDNLLLDLPRLRAQRERIEQLEMESAQLRAKSRLLASRIKRIEAGLSDNTREQLGVRV